MLLGPRGKQGSLRQGQLQREVSGSRAPAKPCPCAAGARGGMVLLQEMVRCSDASSGARLTRAVAALAKQGVLAAKRMSHRMWAAPAANLPPSKCSVLMLCWGTDALLGCFT